MPDALVQVRCFAHHGEGDPSKYPAVAAKLVDQALENIDVFTHPPRMLLLLASRDWCDENNPISRDIRDRFEARIHDRPALIGGSAPQIFCSQPIPQVITNGILLVAIFTPEIRLSVQCLPEPFDGNGVLRKDELGRMVSALRADRNVDIAIGTSAQWALFAFLPGAVPIGGDRDWSYRDGDVCQAISERGGYSLFGVSPASAIDPSLGFQFGNDACLKSGLVLALMEHDLNIGSRLEHGFKPAPNVPELRIDSLADGESRSDGDVSGYVVTRLNGRPAREVLDSVDRIIGSKGRPPIGIRRGDLFELNVPFSYPESPAGSVRFKNRVFEGEWCVPMSCDHLAMAQSCSRGMSLAQSRVRADNNTTALLVEFAGSGRERFYADQGTSWGKVVTEVAGRFPGIPVIGALCTGQYAEFRRQSYAANAHSVWFACLTNERNYRGRNRSELEKIQLAAKDLLRCKTPAEVMEEAIEGAIGAGAEGGCISRLNAGTQRILGIEGRAKARPGSPQKWGLTLGYIDQPGPRNDEDMSLPAELAPWAKPALAGVSNTILSSQSEEENILAIAARTKHALFLPRPDMLLKFRHIKSIALVGIEAQLVIPLIGLEGRVIGVMQIGFRLGVSIDDELFYYWISFAHKVAASLERAEQRVHGENLTKVASLGSRFSQTVLVASINAKQALEDFAYEVREVLDAAYFHLRVRIGPQPVYDLIAPETKIGALHRGVRPFLEPDTGTCRKQLLDSATGVFVNEGGNPDPCPSCQESARPLFQRANP